MIALVLLACGLPCALEVTGPCEATWSDCDEDAGLRRIRLGCTPDELDPGTVRCFCERDGETRATWPEDAAFCEDVEAGKRGVLEEVVEFQCSL